MTSDVKIKYRFCIKQVRSDLTTEKKPENKSIHLKLSAILMTQFTLFYRNLAQIPCFVAFFSSVIKKTNI